MAVALQSLSDIVRVFFASFIILYAPGCALSYCLFPEKALDRVERVFVSIVASLALSSLIAVTLLKLAGGLTPTNFLLVVLALTGVFALGASWQVADTSLVHSARTLFGHPYHLALPLLFVLLLIAVSGGALFHTPSAADVTEFYILPDEMEEVLEGQWDGAEPLLIPVGIANHTSKTASYRIEAWEGNTKLWERPSVSVPSGTAWHSSISLPRSSLTHATDVRLLLYPDSSTAPADDGCTNMSDRLYIWSISLEMELWWCPSRPGQHDQLSGLSVSSDLDIARPLAELRLRLPEK
ncbi:MAG: DUF1616 domain-containing protein [Chloroflexota bacterium]|nr:DUF1616 domain-containing protein [Chloroflexota bacterium]